MMLGFTDRIEVEELGNCSFSGCRKPLTNGQEVYVGSGKNEHYCDQDCVLSAGKYFTNGVSGRPLRIFLKENSNGDGL
jgi:hypothetical protein